MKHQKNRSIKRKQQQPNCFHAMFTILFLIDIVLPRQHNHFQKYLHQLLHQRWHFHALCWFSIDILSLSVKIYYCNWYHYKPQLATNTNAFCLPYIVLVNIVFVYLEDHIAATSTKNSNRLKNKFLSYLSFWNLSQMISVK